MAGKDPRFAVTFLWDFENTEVDSGLVAALATNIENSLQTKDRCFHVTEKVAIGNIKLNFIKPHIGDLRSKRYYVRNAPRRHRSPCISCNPPLLKQQQRERSKDVADRYFIQEILKLVLTQKLGPYILIASGDSDFGCVVDILKRNGYKVFLAVLENSKQSYKCKGAEVWLWGEMSTSTATAIPWRLLTT